MKKVLSVLAVLAVAAGFAFAAENSDTNGNIFKLKTTVDAQPHVFFLSTDDGASAVAANAIVKDDVDLTNDGTYEGVKLYLAAGGNQTKPVTYNFSVSDTDFIGATEGNTATVKTTVALSKTGDTVKAGKVANNVEEATVTVSWKGVPLLAADTYIDTITVTVATNN